MVQMGWEGYWADRTHDKREREGGKEPFWVLLANSPKAKKRAVQAAGCEKKGGEEVREQM